MQSRYLYEDLERLAQNRLSGDVYDYYAGGSSSDTTRGRTLEAWEQFRLIPRVLHSDGRGSDASHFLARELPSPLIVAPMAMASLLHPTGEEGIALAARAAGVSYAASFRSSVRPRTIGEAWHDNARVQLLRDQLPSTHQAAYAAFDDRSMPALWYQVYLVREHEISLACAKEAVNSGFEVAVVTVDTPYLGHRTRDVARGFTPVDLTVARAVVPAELSDSLDEREWVQAMTQRDDLRLEDLQGFRAALGVPVVAKGVLRGDDHAMLAKGGMDGTWFSNHGGRQVDGAIAPIDALRRLEPSEISQGGRVLDGGIRRARDVIVGLASGASVVGVGRHAAWAFAIGGPVALASFLIELRSEIRNLLGLIGTPTVAELDRSFISSVVNWQ